VPNPDDKRFEGYLKQFRPVAPEALHTSKPGRRLRLSVFAPSAVAVMVVLIAAVLITGPRLRSTHDAEGIGGLTAVGELGEAQRLTIGSVNALLGRASSVNAAVDQLAHQPLITSLPKGRQSALAVLSKEDTKL
jgi:hypothetical protein